MIETYLVKHCAPTLASLKTAGLFTFSFNNENDLDRQIAFCNELINNKGVYITILKKKQNTALIYVYRKNKLSMDMEQNGVFNFLQMYGYKSTDVDYAIEKLKQRVNSSDVFPHEIGMFLGYPLSDVIGFINNSGRNSKMTGYWKVYGDVSNAVNLFNKFNKCRRVYAKKYFDGTSIQKLTVAVTAKN